MLDYLIQTSEVNRILNLFSRVMDFRVDFFDLQGEPLRLFDVKEPAAYCRRLRRQREFDQRCKRCDKEHIQMAARGGQPIVYRCHAGLWEAVIPLKDRTGQYIGSLVFGQMRPTQSESPWGKNHPLTALYNKLPSITASRIRQLASLLKYLAEYMITQELIRKRDPDWAQRTCAYIQAHLDARLTAKELSRVIGRSPSFISHQFKKTFGVSLRQYIIQQRLDCSLNMLQAGDPLRKISSSLGFSDEFHFSKTFRRHFKKSPSGYRRSALS